MKEIKLTKIDEIKRYNPTKHTWKVKPCLKCGKLIMYRKVFNFAGILVKDLGHNECEHIFQDGEKTYYLNPHLLKE